MKKNKETLAEDTKHTHEAFDVLYDKASKTYSIVKVKYVLDEVNKDDITVMTGGQALTDLHLKKLVANKFMKFNKGE